MISIEHLSKHFGGLKAVDDVSINISKGSITGLIGPNGAGKTTLFNTVAGLHAPTDGRVLLDGEDITGLEPHRLFAKGLLRTFQIAHEYSRMSVTENLMMVPPGQSGESLIHAWFHPGRVGTGRRCDLSEGPGGDRFSESGGRSLMNWQAISPAARKSCWNLAVP